VKKGDIVRVKPGVKDVDFDADLSGWQGRVVDVHAETVEVAWDSYTLRHEMPSEMITACEEQGLDWAIYFVRPHDLEPAEPRDTQADVEQAVEELARQHAWDWLGKEGKLVREVLAGIHPKDYDELMKAWYEYMKTHLTLPFEGRVAEPQDRGPLRAGDCVRVDRMMSIASFYGVIVRLRRGRKQYDFPLCDLEPLDETSENYRILRGYRVWFANR
jgi:hypothetical protein